MSEIKYGDRIITYEFIERPDLKSHYITVEKGKGVFLKGKFVPEHKANELILKKARWITDKLTLVESIEHKDIFTGSRIQYLGRNYYTTIQFDAKANKPKVEFTESKFIISLPDGIPDVQSAIHNALELFYRQRAKEKILPRIMKWSERTKMIPSKIKFLKLEKRWGSCTGDNNILINYQAVKLPYTLIDYLIVHELCHTIEKNHSKRFYGLVGKYLPDWKKLDGLMFEMKM